MLNYLMQRSLKTEQCEGELGYVLGEKCLMI